MMDVMEVVDYTSRNFNHDPMERHHPYHMTEGHFIYHLDKDDASGYMYCKKNSQGQFVMSPRSLSAMCTYKLVINTDLLKEVRGHDLPSALYPSMLSEAIYQREVHSIENLVSTWPMPSLRVYDMIPLEDTLDASYLTKRLEGFTSSLLDCFMLGLLNLKPESRLDFIDFTGFDKDPVLCRELLRLPIIWLKPENRSVDSIHEHLSPTLDVTKDKVERYLNRIRLIYSNLDSEFKHGSDIGKVTIMLDCKFNLDDVPIGLALQKVTPFRFVCNRLWMETIPDVSLAFSQIPVVLNSELITHFEVESQLISHQALVLDSLLETLVCLPHLTALGLPGSIDTEMLDKSNCERIGETLQKLTNVEKLNLSSCNLQNHAKIVLGRMEQTLTYLNLRDCRLTELDMWFILQWQPLCGLRELNLSRNCLQSMEYAIHALLNDIPLLTCFSISFCQLTIPALCRIARQCLSLQCLKVLSMQCFVPPPYEELHNILYDCVQVETLQKCLLLPAAYAFPGGNEEAREENKFNLLTACYHYIERKGRRDLFLE